MRKRKEREKVGGANALSEEINRIMVSNGPVLRNSMSKDEFSFSQSSALGSSEESGSHANFIFESGRNELQSISSLSTNGQQHQQQGNSGNWTVKQGTAAELGGEATALAWPNRASG
nr:WD repeat-containing protein 44-like [Ipomoea trifida]